MYLINLAVEKAVGMPFGISNDKSQSQLFEICRLLFEIRRFATTWSEGSHRSVHRQYVRMRVRRDNEASAPYRRIRDLAFRLDRQSRSD